MYCSYMLSVGHLQTTPRESRPICSDSLNLMPPVPLHLLTLWCYTDAVIIIILSSSLLLINAVINEQVIFTLFSQSFNEYIDACSKGPV